MHIIDGKNGTPRQKNALYTAHGTILQKYGKNFLAGKLLPCCRVLTFLQFSKRYVTFFCRIFCEKQKTRFLARRTERSKRRPSMMHVQAAVTNKVYTTLYMFFISTPCMYLYITIGLVTCKFRWAKTF